MNSPLSMKHPTPAHTAAIQSVRGVDRFLNPGGLTVVWGAKSAHPGSNRVNWSAEFRGGSGPPGPPSSYTSDMCKRRPGMC